MDYHPKKEIANTISHGIGLVMALFASPLLLIRAWETGEEIRILSIVIYVFGLLTVYFSSTLYHASKKPRQKVRLRIWDHISIYYLIAGTYTPFIALFWNFWWAPYFLAGLWFLVLIGTVFKLYFTHRFKIISTAAYVIMGWMVLPIAKPVFNLLPSDLLFWLGIGGIFYMIGVVFYLWKKLFYHHAIWHVWVMLGSISHFIAIWNSVSVEMLRAN